MARFEFQPNNPDEIDVSMTITMTVKRWDELAARLRTLENVQGPVQWLINHIGEANRWSRRHFYVEDEPFDLQGWSAQWQNDARIFFERHELPYRMTNALIRATNVLNGEDKCQLFSHRDYPYPGFDDSIAGIVHGTYPVRNFGIKYRALLAEALEKDAQEN